MRYAIKNHNLQNMDSAIDQYLNTNKSSFEIVSEFGICKATLFNRLKIMRELQEGNKKKDIKIKKTINKNVSLNNTSSQNSPIIEKQKKNKKEKIIKKKDDITIKLIGGENHDLKSNSTDENINISINKTIPINENENDECNKVVSDKVVSDKINISEILEISQQIKNKYVIKINENKCKKKYLTNDEYEDCINNGIEIYLYDDFIKLRKNDINNQVKEYIKNNR